MECYTLTEQNIFFFSIVLASDMKPGVEVRPMEYWGNILNAAPSFMLFCYPWPSLPPTLSSLGQFSYC